jgi:hypothetical protein
MAAFKLLSQHDVGSEEEHEQPQNRACSVRNSKDAAPKYKTETLPLELHCPASKLILI